MEGKSVYNKRWWQNLKAHTACMGIYELLLLECRCVSYGNNTQFLHLYNTTFYKCILKEEIKISRDGVVERINASTFGMVSLDFNSPICPWSEYNWRSYVTFHTIFSSPRYEGFLDDFLYTFKSCIVVISLYFLSCFYLSN